MVELAQLRRYILEQWQRGRRAGRGPRFGPLPAFFSGQGMELHDRKPYQAGDELRYLDWRATARSGRAISKVFLDERGRNLYLFIDRRPPMFFGTRVELKAATAARAAAILAYTALAAREQVSGMIYEQDCHHFPGSRSLSGVLPLLLAAAAPAPEHEAKADDKRLPPWEKLLTEIARRISPGSDVCLLSDFHGLTEAHLPAIQALARRASIHAIAIHDPGEAVLKPVGRIRLQSPLDGREFVIDSEQHKLQQRYATAMMQHRRLIERLFQRAAVPLISVSNQQNMLSQLEGIHAAPH